MPTRDQCLSAIAEVRSDPGWSNASKGEVSTEAAKRLGVRRSAFYAAAELGRARVFHVCRFCGAKRQTRKCHTIRKGYCEDCRDRHEEERRKTSAVNRMLSASEHAARRRLKDPWEAWAINRSWTVNQTRRLNKGKWKEASASCWAAALEASVRNLEGRYRRALVSDWDQKLKTLASSLRRERNGMTAKIKTTELRSLLEKQGERCALTGVDLTPQNCSADHVVPVSRGGKHSIENIQLVTKVANRAKHTLTNDEFFELCSKVVNHHDPLAVIDGAKGGSCREAHGDHPNQQEAKGSCVCNEEPYLTGAAEPEG